MLYNNEKRKLGAVLSGKIPLEKSLTGQRRENLGAELIMKGLAEQTRKPGAQLQPGETRVVSRIVVQF